MSSCKQLLKAHFFYTPQLTPLTILNYHPLSRLSTLTPPKFSSTKWGAKTPQLARSCQVSNLHFASTLPILQLLYYCLVIKIDRELTRISNKESIDLFCNTVSPEFIYKNSVQNCFLTLQFKKLLKFEYMQDGYCCFMPNFRAECRIPPLYDSFSFVWVYILV